MRIVRPVLVALLVIFVGWMFYWALFAPKKNASQVIYETLKEQEKRADLSFKKVTFEEVNAGEKFWQLSADTAVVNKNSGVATLRNTDGTFYKKGKAVLRFRSPGALWDMKKKEIYLDKPLGYDVVYERQILSLVRSLKAKPQSLFNLPKEYNKGIGYWFQAKNLSWKVSDQLLLCTGGIMLNKGEVTGYADSLSGDVEFKKVKLDGSPRVVIAPAKGSPISIEAESFEISSSQDLVTAHGNPVVNWRDAKITALEGRYYQSEKKLSLAGNVAISYKDISAWGASADYLTDEQKVILTGNARAVQGDSNLSSDKVLVSLKDQKISLMGRSKVTITEGAPKP